MADKVEVLVAFSVLILGLCTEQEDQNVYGSEKSFDKGNFKETINIWQKNCNLAIERITLIVEYRMLPNDYTKFLM